MYISPTLHALFPLWLSFFWPKTVNEGKDNIGRLGILFLLNRQKPGYNFKYSEWFETFVYFVVRETHSVREIWDDCQAIEISN